jgi:ribosome maturation factor RimP
VLRGFQDGSVIVEAEGESVSIPLEDIKRARVKGKIDFNA